MFMALGDIVKRMNKTSAVEEPAVGYTPVKELNSADLQNLKEIEQFLQDTEIPYIKSDDGMTFSLGCSPDSEKRPYHIKYVPARWFPVNSVKYKIEGVPSSYFAKQSIQAEERGEFICWTKDYEWKDDRKREVLKSYWTYEARKIKTSFYARECEVRLVPTKEAREFESENCFYGKRGASLNLGLYSKKDKGPVKKGDLLMVYTFGLAFLGGKNNQINSVEVLRVGTLKFCNAIGGASKLLKYFIDNHRTVKIGDKDVRVDNVIFYSDYDHNSGSSMQSLAFQFVDFSHGGFMNDWFPGTENEHIKGRQPAKHKWVMEQTRLGNVIAIPNAGVKTFNLNIDKYLKENAKED
jgi:hypothetical protein